MVQKIGVRLFWLAAGALAVGGAINAISVSLLVPTPITLITISSLVSFLAMSHVYLRRGRAWRIRGKTVVVRQLGPGVYWFCYGVILLLLIPRAVDVFKQYTAERQQHVDQMSTTF